jgi:hypothetical protein
MYPGDRATDKWLGVPGNQFKLKLFLKLHGFDIDQVREIRFSNQGFRVEEMERDEDGRLVLGEDGLNPKFTEKKARYLTSKPTWA